MPIISKVRHYNWVGGIGNPGVNLVLEDPRPGHNVLYLGSDFNAFDSITLKPIFGVVGNLVEYSNTSIGGANSLQSSSQNGEYANRAYMRLAGANPCGYGMNQWTSTINGSNFYINAPSSSAWQMDNSFTNNMIHYKDNGDGTSDIFTNNREPIASGIYESYCNLMWFQGVKDDQELYDVVQSYNQTLSTQNNPVYSGPYIGFSNLDGTNAGLVAIPSINAASYTQRQYLASFTYHSSMASEASLEQNSVGYYAQSVGISAADGNPIVLEMAMSVYNPVWRISKYNGSTWTNLLANNQATSGQTPFQSYTGSGTYDHSSTYDHASGTADSYYRFGSQWTKMNGSTSKYKFSFHPLWDSNERLCLFCIRWDTTNDTFVTAGLQGAGTSSATMYHMAQNGYSTWQSLNTSYLEAPVTDNGNLGTNNTASTYQSSVYSIWADVHGYANRYGDSETFWDAESQTWQDNPVATELQPISIFPASGYDQWDQNEKQRRIVCGYTDSQNGDTCYYYNYTGITTVPEMPYDWVWLNSGKTCIAAICKNNTYLYQCRKGDSLLDQSDSSGTVWSPANESFNADIHDASATAMGWVHTGTIPFQVIQMGTDKHDRVWYVTWQADSQYANVATNAYQYQKQLWMMTDQTPFRVNLTGNVTTDTITHSGSNINKTLTIEARNFKGQRLAKSITLNITGSDAQFDNGSQTKNVQTSATATVDETITITGSGSFNITAAFGA